MEIVILNVKRIIMTVFFCFVFSIEINGEFH